MGYNKDNVKDLLDFEDIYRILDYLGAEPQDHGNHLVCKTICHGGDSHKLYYYDEQRLFHCYTGDCGSFDIFELVCKVEHLKLNDAISFVVSFFDLYVLDQEKIDQSEDWQYLTRWEEIDQIYQQTINRENNEVKLKIYDNVIENFPHPFIYSWAQEGISKEACDFMDIRFDPMNGGVLIPHYDKNSNLVGIRTRTFIQEQEVYGKYRPWKYHNLIYSHPLAFNLYGLDRAKDNIKDIEMAIVVESEKSVLQYLSYYGKCNSICVAVCGSSLSKYQFNLLKNLGIKELVIGFDKDFTEIGSNDFQKVKKKLLNIWNKYKNDVNISFLFDKYGLLQEKNSPLDQGPDAFKYLFENRLVI